MSDVNLSPNMSLPVPAVGVDSGPDWANNLNACLSILDQHSHTSGSGIAITPAAININSALSFGGNLAVDVGGISLSGQASSPANSTIYNSNNASGDLYYTNAAGLSIQITNASGIVGSPGTISGISGTATASYSAPTFFWRSATSIAANLDFGAAIMRNISPNSTYALTLQPPASLASNFSITLPTIPGVTSFLTMDASGNMGATALNGALTTSNLSSSAGIVGSQIASSTITGGNIAAQTIVNANILDGTLSTSKLAFTPVQTVTAGSGLVGGGSSSSVTLAIAAVTPAAVGSYAFLAPTPAAVYSIGSTIAGVNTTYAGIASGGGIQSSGTSPSGTWQCMGYVDTTGGQAAGLWQRIS